MDNNLEGSLDATTGASLTTNQNVDTKANDQHIMISYNHKSAGILAKRINKRLKENNYKTWVDYEQMNGSIYNAMADGIDKSFVVLVFVTDEYCKSPNCIKECEYATRKGKKIIPIKVNSQYEPANAHGIVGLTVGGILYIDFSRPDIDDSMQQLLDQIRRVEHEVKNVDPTQITREYTRKRNLRYLRKALINNKKLAVVIAFLFVIIVAQTIVIIVSFSMDRKAKCSLDKIEQIQQVKDIEPNQTEFRYSLKISNEESVVFMGAKKWIYYKNGKDIATFQEIQRDVEGVIVVNPKNETIRLSSLCITFIEPQPQWKKARWNNVWKKTYENHLIYPKFNLDWFEIQDGQAYTDHELKNVDLTGDTIELDGNLRLNSFGLYTKNPLGEFQFLIDGTWIYKF